MTRRGQAIRAACLTLVLAACAADSPEADPSGAPTTPPSTATPSTTTRASAEAPRTTTATTTAATTATTTATTATTTATTTTATTTTAPTTTETSGLVGLASDAVQVLEIGRSVQDRPIVAVERGTPGGTVVLVIGVIHGDEDDGVAIVERLATAPVPPGVDLWLIESMNPDGQALGQRGNAAGVDLNRNFPHEWGPIAQPGDPQYAGTGAASEPETRAIVDFVSAIRPTLGLWYHQDLFRLSPGDGLEGELKDRYAQLTGVPILPITGGTYTGVAATWQRRTLDATSFIVELGPTLGAAEADVHAAAVLDLGAIVAAQ